MAQHVQSNAEDDDVFETPGGSLVISHPAQGTMVFTYRGYMTANVVPFIERRVARVVDAGLTPDLFIDLERITGYDSEYRQAISKWGARSYRHFGEVRVLVKSLFVAMGIAVSNLTAGGKLKPTTKRLEFQAAIDRAVARRSTTG